MGGNIWKDKSVRLPLKEYKQLLADVKNMLYEDVVLDQNELQEIAFIKNKEDFGDLDLLLTTRFEHKNSLLKLLKNRQLLYSVNGDVVSFLYNNFQVDIIFINHESLDYAKNYFSWNDAGNLIGRMIKQLGFKHGHEGLYYVNRQSTTRILSTTLVSKDYLDSLRILKLDINKFLKGFDTKEDLFNWVISSPYFNPEIFKFENLNHTNRVRDRKRATYNSFLQYTATLNADDFFVYKFNRESIALYNFPELLKVINYDNNRLVINEKLKTVTDGEYISSFLNIPKNENLGKFIKYLKNIENSESILLHIADNIEMLPDFILKSYNEYLNITNEN